MTDHLPEHLEHEIGEIAASICNETCSESDQSRLQELLFENEAAQAFYMQYMQLHAELFWLQDEWCTREPSLTAGDCRSNDSPPALGLGTRGVGALAGNWFWPLALAATLLLGASLGMFFSNWMESNNGATQSIPSTPRIRVASVTTPRIRVASVTGSLNCRWDGEYGREPIGFGSDLYSGQKLDLVEEIAEITYETGVRVILQAPAVLDLTGPEASLLHHGRITASVPKGAEGYRVTTDSLTLVDRGTEFGVLADQQGNTFVHVFDGLVEGHYTGLEDGSLKTVEWRTNDTIQFDKASREITLVDRSTANFVRALAPALGPFNGLLTDEEFDYPTGPLGGQNGGFGWGGPWHDLTFQDQAPESNGIGNGSLRFGVLSSSGNHALLGGQFNRIRRVFSTSFGGVFDSAGLVEDQDGQRLIGRSGSTIYLSFAQRVSMVDQVFYGIELNRGDGNKNRVLCVGHAAAKGWFEGPVRSPNKDAGVTGWAVTSEFNQNPGGGLQEYGDLGPETTDVVFFVVKIVFGPGNQDVVKVYKNPRSLWDESICEPVIEGRGNFAFDRIGLANFEGDKTFQVDHIRVGTNFAAVTRPRWSSDPVASR